MIVILFLMWTIAFCSFLKYKIQYALTIAGQRESFKSEFNGDTSVWILLIISLILFFLYLSSGLLLYDFSSFLIGVNFFVVICLLIGKRYYSKELNKMYSDKEYYLKKQIEFRTSYPDFKYPIYFGLDLVDEEKVEDPKMEKMKNHLLRFSFEKYIGNKDISNTAKILVDRFLEKGKPIPHILLFGMPGTGKTTLAKTMANEAGVNFFETVSRSFRNTNDVILALTKLKRGDVLFIDEIHGLKIELEEVMYSAMQDSYISTPEGEILHLPKFSIIGATTIPEDVSKPLRDRFEYHFDIPLYTEEDISKIVSNISTFPMTEKCAKLIAQRSFGTPRVAINYYKNIKIYVESKNEQIIKECHVEDVFAQKKIDSLGLGTYHYAAMEKLANQDSFAMGIQSLSTAIGVSKKMFETYIQPGLFYNDFIDISTKGRRLKYKGLIKYSEEKNIDLISEDEYKNSTI